MIDYVEYVVCTRYYTLYNFSECTIDNHSQQKSKKCFFIHFPNHPHPSRRNEDDFLSAVYEHIQLKTKSDYS